MLPLTVIAQGLDKLVFGHRGASLDAGLSGLLAQLLDGLLRKVLPVLGLALPGVAGSARALAGSTWRRSVGAACSAVPGPRPPARPTLVTAAFLRLRAVRTRSAGSPMPGTARITAAWRPRRVSLLYRRPTRAGRLRVVVKLWRRAGGRLPRCARGCCEAAQGCPCRSRPPAWGLSAAAYPDLHPPTGKQLAPAASDLPEARPTRGLGSPQRSGGVVAWSRPAWVSGVHGGRCGGSCGRAGSYPLG